MASQQITVTVTGNLAADPVGFGRDPSAPAASMRVGVTPRYFDGRDGMWKDRGTSWVNVRAFRTLAANAVKSLRKGDAVIVTGTLRCDQWEKDGVSHLTPVVEATAIGHDLNCGVAAFTRNPRKSAGQPAGLASQTAGTGFGQSGGPGNGQSDADAAVVSSQSGATCPSDPTGQSAGAAVPSGADPFDDATEEPASAEF